MKIRLSKAISWVGPEKKGVSKIFFLTFLTSDKHSMAKKSDRTHHSFSDPTLKRPSKDPIRSLREHTIGEHKSKVFQKSSRGIQDSRGYVPPLDHTQIFIVLHVTTFSQLIKCMIDFIPDCFLFIIFVAHIQQPLACNVMIIS